jgi:hypothetical protein
MTEEDKEPRKQSICGIGWINSYEANGDLSDRKKTEPENAKFHVK